MVSRYICLASHDKKTEELEMGNTGVITVKSAVQDTKSYTYGFLLD